MPRLASSLVIVTALALSACSNGADRTASTAASTTGDTASSAPAPAPETDGSDPGGPVCEAADEPTTVQYRAVQDVEPDLLSLDAYAAPAGCAAPVVVWVHGGGYRVGDKANGMRDKIRLAAEQGWLLVSVNYRLSDPTDPGSARFPDHYEDVAHAVAWVREHIDEHGGDPGRIALLGHSAGADIVANVTTVPDHLAGVGLRLADVTCAGTLDTAGFDKTAPGLDAEARLWEAALGNEPDYRVRTSATRQARPGIGIPPTISVVRGTRARQAVQVGHLEALEAAGVPTTRIDATSLTHAEVNHRIGAQGDMVMTPPLTSFLDACFGR